MLQFVIQYSLVILTIVLIPLLLRIGKSKDIAPLTYSVFGLLVVADVCAYYFVAELPSYVYLAVITVLASCLVKRKKQCNSQQ